MNTESSYKIETQKGQYGFSQNWFLQLKNKISNYNKLSRELYLTIEEQRGLLHTKFKFAVTPYLLSLIDPNNEHCPIRKQFIPTIDEIKILPEELSTQKIQNDTSKNEVLVLPEIVHRYADRITILLTDQCAAYCRFCSYKNFVGKNESEITNNELHLVIKYLKQHTEINHVILSGGDPLTLSDEKLEFVLKHLRQIPHVSVIRIETRIPVVLPQRITTKLCNILKKYQPVYLNIMVNHPKELNDYTEYVCNILSDHGIPLSSNTVLLKGINDKVQILAELFNKLLKLRIRPYQMLQCAIVEGTSHFRVAVSVGIKIIKQLRSLISWFAIPNFVVHTTQNSKVVIEPQVVISKTRSSVMIKDFNDNIFIYPEIKQ